MRFLNYKYGADAKQTSSYQHFKEDETAYGNYMVNACERLDSLYNALPANFSFHDKLQLKYKLISEIILNINQLPLYNKQRYTFSFPEDQLPNNAWFMSYKRYRVNQNDFDNELKEKYDGRLELFISALKNQ